MLFYLTTLNLAQYTHEIVLVLSKGEIDRQIVAAVEAWKHGDFLCWNYILNSLANTLCNVYYVKGIARELWESLELQYKT